MRWSRKHTLFCGLFVAGLTGWLGSAPYGRCQGTSGPTVSNSKVGYIDSAILGDLFRLRYDSTYDNRRPSRAEFFYAKTGPFGPGLPQPEPRVDYQDISAYLETAFLPRCSAFVEAPVRFLNPQVNGNTAGLGDLQAGLRFGMVQTECGAVTLQLRTYIPTGDADRGLSTNHVSLEPALLFYRPIGARAGVEGELRYWIPVGGTEFAGDVIRYGLGFHYEAFNNGRLGVSPVVEFVGWTVLDGQESIVRPGLPVEIRDAAGDSILHIKVGIRTRLGDRVDIYGGYGHPLTGQRWYENTLRLELRWLY